MGTKYCYDDQMSWAGNAKFLQYRNSMISEGKIPLEAEDYKSVSTILKWISGDRSGRIWTGHVRVWIWTGGGLI